MTHEAPRLRPTPQVLSLSGSQRLPYADRPMQDRALDTYHGSSSKSSVDHTTLARQHKPNWLMRLLHGVFKKKR